MKAFISIGDEVIEAKLSEINEIEVVESENDLDRLKDIIKFLNADFLIINRALDVTGEKIIEIAEMAKKKNVKIIVLLKDIKSFDERKLITSLVTNDVYSFINFNDVKKEVLIRIMENYPQEFDFRFFFDKNFTKKVREKKESNFKNKIIDKKQKITKIEKTVKPETVEVEFLNNAVIAIYSDCSNGKSVISWILSFCLVDKGYSTIVINLDKGYSANNFYDIGNTEYMGVFNALNNNDPSQICCNYNDKFNIICGPPGSKAELNNDEFLSVLNSVRIKNNITIIDCKSNLNELTKISLQQSTLDLLIFDLDSNHYNQNINMLEQLGDNFNPEKTIVVINNALVESSSYKKTLQSIKNTGLNFRNIVTIRNCGDRIYELMFKDTTPYFDKDTSADFKNDINSLLDSIKSREAEKGFFKKLFKWR